MSKKELPKVKRDLKTFILEEDAKVIDKSATKVALTASFLALNTILNAGDANAKGHNNHSNHSNFPKIVEDGLNNPGNETQEHEFVEKESYSGREFSMEVESPPKSVTSAHGNHYNHVDSSGGSS